MKLFNRRMVLLAASVCFVSRIALAAEPGSQETFATPEDAIAALRTATSANDHAALVKIFGPEVNGMLTSDKTQDANNAKGFSAALAANCTPMKEGDDKVTLQVGTNNWPMAIPLVKDGTQWRFDTVAGKEEIINRHIGKDELHAIGVCRAYVKAQEQFAAANAGGEKVYAEKFKSSPGKKDGLFWPSSDGNGTSPFGPVVAEAHQEGYGRGSASLHPFHGYYFRILTRQGDAAPGGKMDYMSHGKLTGGFALVAYPEKWDQSGIMTFIVNQDGKVYQQNLGEKTAHVVREINEYNPAYGWSEVEDPGVLTAVSEK